MKTVQFVIDPEESAYAHASLLAVGIAADLVRRGADGDVIAVPRKDEGEARGILGL